ncbi:MAG: glutathione S-transferase, partial [Motiliproteus sp.]
MSTIKLYRHPLSGHSHRVEVLLSLLSIDAEIIDVDLMTGAQRAPEFINKNPQGQVPVLEDGAITLSDSNAIIHYLASKYDPDRSWLPSAPEKAAVVQRYLTIAAGALAFGPASARLITLFGADLNPDYAIAISHKLLLRLDSDLSSRPWLAGDQPTLADVANYAYIAVAPEGNVSLDDYAN